VVTQNGFSPAHIERAWLQMTDIMPVFDKMQYSDCKRVAYMLQWTLYGKISLDCLS